MRRETWKLSLPCTCEDAYDFLVDYRNDAIWRDEISEIVLVSGAVGESGAMYEGHLDWHGLGATHTAQTVEAVRPSKIHLRSETPEHAIDVVYLLASNEGGCELSCEYMLAMTGPTGLLEPFGWSLFAGWIKDDLPKLAGAIEEYSNARPVGQ